SGPSWCSMVARIDVGQPPSDILGEVTLGHSAATRHAWTRASIAARIDTGKLGHAPMTATSSGSVPGDEGNRARSRSLSVGECNGECNGASDAERKSLALHSVASGWTRVRSPPPPSLVHLSP